MNTESQSVHVNGNVYMLELVHGGHDWLLWPEPQQPNVRLAAKMNIEVGGDL